MGMDIGGLLAAGGTGVDTLLANLTSGANALNRGIVGKGFQDAVIPQVEATTGQVRNQANWIDQFGGDTYGRRAAAFADNMSGYGAAQRGEGPAATQIRQGYGQAQQDMQGAIDYGDSVVNPLLQNAGQAYDIAKGQYDETRGKMAQATTDAVAQARTGLSKTLQAGEDIISGISDQVGTMMVGVSSRLEAVQQDVETRAQQLEQSGNLAAAESLRKQGAFKMAEQTGNGAMELGALRSRMLTEAKQRNVSDMQAANNAVVQAIAGTAASEAGANATSVQNLINAVATGNQAAGLAIQGPMAARIQKAAMGERFATNMAQAVRMDAQDVEAHALNIDNQIASNAQQYIGNVLSSAQAILNALSYTLQGHGAVAQILSGVLYQFTPGAALAVNDYLQINAANQEPPGPNGFDHVANVANAAAPWAWMGMS